MLTVNSSLEAKLLNLPRIVCAVGVFDGIHLGHQKIINSVVNRARQIKGTASIITFDKHPNTVLNPSLHIPVLTPTLLKLYLLEKLKVDLCILINFNKNIASTTAEDWIKEILWKHLHIDTIYIGRDSFFGNSRKGNVQLLMQWGNRLGFKVNTIEPVRADKEEVSSTLIKNTIEAGDIESAERLLGRLYSVTGTVINGKGIGKTIGFPTANLNTANQCLPSNGVYAVNVNISDKTIRAAANIGTRPTFNSAETKPILEIHLLKNQDTLYNQKITVTFIKRIRDEIQFKDSAKLVQQIKKDIIYIKKFFG